ncbi:MAG: hypothetical protein OXU45_06090 [Candidatus Melainabacteria bacterium]|nr:hypothetical protein [Candidatus Melainabacteria bacterium]
MLTIVPKQRQNPEQTGLKLTLLDKVFRLPEILADASKAGLARMEPGDIHLGSYAALHREVEGARTAIADGGRLVDLEARDQAADKENLDLGEILKQAFEASVSLLTGNGLKDATRKEGVTNITRLELLSQVHRAA